MIFHRSGPRYTVQIVTGPQSILLSLGLQTERVGDPSVVSIADAYPYKNPGEEKVRAAVLQGTDAANGDCRTNYHPSEIVCAVESWNDGCSLIRRAAYAIVERLATRGDAEYASA